MGLHKIPVTKGKGFVEIESEQLPEAVYVEALRQGLKLLINRGMTKITKAAYPKEDEMHAAAMEKAQATVVDMLAGKIRIMGAKADKVSGAVMTEARKIAKAIVKAAMKEKGIKISYVEASEITKAANALIAANASIIAQAEANLKKQEDETAALKDSLAQIVTPGMVSAKKQAKKEEEKAKAKEASAGVLSAAKAGQISTKAKGQGKPAAATAH